MRRRAASSPPRSIDRANATITATRRARARQAQGIASSGTTPRRRSQLDVAESQTFSAPHRIDRRKPARAMPNAARAPGPPTGIGRSSNGAAAAIPTPTAPQVTCPAANGFSHPRRRRQSSTPERGRRPRVRQASRHESDDGAPPMSIATRRRSSAVRSRRLLRTIICAAARANQSRLDLYR